MSKKTFKVYIDDKEIEYEILCTYTLTDTNKNYIIYTDNLYDTNNNLNVYASIYYPNNLSKGFDNIVTDYEWEKVNEMLKQVFVNE